MNPYHLLLGVVAFALSPCASVLAINIVTNPGFETGNFTGWTLTTNGGFGGVTNLPSAHHSGSFGAQFVNGHNPSFLSQDLVTVSGATYNVDLWLSFPVEGGISSFDVSFDGTNVFHLFPQNTFGYTEYSFNVVATSPLSTLQFRFLEGLWDFDDVSVQFVSGPNTVPETGHTLVLFGLALAAIEGLRRKLTLA